MTEPATPAGVPGSRRSGPRTRPLQFGAPLALVLLAVGLAANALVLLHYSDGIYFWADEFDLLFRRGVIPSEDVGLLVPHSGHLMAAPILIYRGLVGVFGLGSYTPWAVTQICFHLAICVTIALVLRRIGTRPAVATGAALLVAWWGIGANGQIWAAGMNHSGSLLLGLLAVYVVAGPSTDRRAWLVGTVLLAVAVTDRVEHALSAVYTFYDPDHAARGLGTLAVLRQIEWARRERLDYLYLGYWIDGHRKMDYKRRFRPLEVFTGREWRPLEPGDDA